MEFSIAIIVAKICAAVFAFTAGISFQRLCIDYYDDSAIANAFYFVISILMAGVILALI